MQAPRSALQPCAARFQQGNPPREYHIPSLSYSQNLHFIQQRVLLHVLSGINTYIMNGDKAILTIKQDDSGVTNIKVTFPTFTKHKDGYYFVQCPYFKTVGYSTKSLEDAHKDHEEDIKLFFLSHIKKGSLAVALYTLGWGRDANEEYKAPNIPFYLLSRAESQSLSFAA